MPKQRPERLFKYDLTKKFTSVSGSVYYSSGDPTEHLILWARAATKDPVPTTAEDASTGGHTVTFQDGPTSNNGALNQTAHTTPFSSLKLANVNSAVRFPKNANAYVKVNDAENLSFGNGSADSSFSLSTWVQITSASSTVGLVQKGLGTGGAPNEYKIFYHDGDLTGSLSDVSASATLNFFASPDALFTEDAWHHVAFTYNASLTKTGRGKFYFDGRFISGSCSESGTYVAMEAGAANLRIAENMNNQPMEFMQAAIWSGKVLSDEDINALYNASKGIKDVTKERVYVGSTGVTSLPVRPYLQSIDNATGSYPTTYRLGDSRAGHYSASFDDTTAIRFQKQGVNTGLSAQITLGQQLRQGSQYSGSLVVAPNTVPDLALTSSATSVLPGVSDARVRFTPGDDFTPYKEVEQFAADEVGSSDQFWATGTLPSIVGPGFTNPLWSKTKIEIDLNPATDSDIFWSTGSADSPIGSGFAYYNFDLKQWEMLGCDITGSAVDYVNAVPAVATGSLLAYVPGRNTNWSGLDAVSEEIQLQSGYPTTYAGFPSAVQFNATSSQLFDVSSVISHPFVVEKVAYEFSGSLPLGTNNNLREKTYFNFGILNHHQNARLLNSFATTFYNTGSNQTGTPSTNPANYNMDIMRNVAERRVTVPKDLISHGVVAICEDFDAKPFQRRDLNIQVPSSPSPSSNAYRGTTGSFILSMSANTPVYAQTLQFHDAFVSGGGRGGWLGSTKFLRRFLSYQGGGRTGLTNGIDGGLLSTGRSFARSNAAANLSGSLQIIRFDVATTGLGFQLYDKVRQDAPYLLMPGDKLSFYWANQKWIEFSRTTEMDVSKFKLRLSPGKGKLVLYGSMLRDGSEFHQGLNQHLTSDAIHEDVQSSATDSSPYCLDQFQVEYYQTYSGSYSDYAIEAIKSRNPTVGASRLSIKPHSVVGGLAGNTGSILRGVRLPDLNERFLDSLFPDVGIVADANSVKIRYDASGNVSTNFQSGKLAFYPLGDVSGGDVTWPRSFPFDDRYGGSDLQRTAGLLSRTPATNIPGTSSPSKEQFRNITTLTPRQDSGEASDHKYVTLITTNTTAATIPEFNRVFFKSFYGFGDSISFKLPKVFKKLNRSASTNIFGGRDVEIRGFKYGLISSLPTFTSAVYRRDRFGQPRDMLEQRQYSAFEKYKFTLDSDNPQDDQGRRVIVPGQLAAVVATEFKKVVATGQNAEILPLDTADFESIKSLTKNNLRGVWGRGCNTDPFARSQRPFFDSDPLFPSGSFEQLGENKQVDSMLSDLNQGLVIPDIPPSFGF